MKKMLAFLLALLLVFGFTGCDDLSGLVSDIETLSGEIESIASWIEETETIGTPQEAKASDPIPISESGWYYSKDDVALYLYTFGHLPGNFVTKNEARDLGWEGGSVEDYMPGLAIGGDVFGNREGLLPEARGRTYYECDIDTRGKDSRGAKRIVFSNDGLIYYTDDHYESFTLLYGEE